jgi:peptide/nickel transport system substrate-binding protein
MQMYATAVPTIEMAHEIVAVGAIPRREPEGKKRACLFWHQACRVGSDCHAPELSLMRVRNSLHLAVLAVVLSAFSARAESMVRYGISMADIPLTTPVPINSPDIRSMTR